MDKKNREFEAKVLNPGNILWACKIPIKNAVSKIRRDASAMYAIAGLLRRVLV